MHEVEDHRDDVLNPNDVRVVERVLQYERWNRSAKERSLQPREIVRGKAGLRREPAHRLISKEEQEERGPVLDERAAAAQRDRDHKQGQQRPLRLDGASAPQHHAEDEQQIDNAPDKEQARPAPEPGPDLSGGGQTPPPRSRQSQKREARSRRARSWCADRPRRAPPRTGRRRHSTPSADRQSPPRRERNQPPGSTVQRFPGRRPNRSAPAR